MIELNDNAIEYIENRGFSDIVIDVIRSEAWCGKDGQDRHSLRGEAVAQQLRDRWAQAGKGTGQELYP